MATPDDLDVLPLFAALNPDGTILLELAVGDQDRLVKATMPPSDHSLRLARDVVVPLDLDELAAVAPELSVDVEWFCACLRDRLVARADADGSRIRTRT